MVHISSSDGNLGSKIAVTAGTLATALIANNPPQPPPPGADASGEVLETLLLGAVGLSSFLEKGDLVLHRAEVITTGGVLPVGKKMRLKIDYSVAATVTGINVGVMSLQMQPNQPLRVRVREVILTIDPEASGLKMVSLDYTRSSLEVEDPGGWQVAGPGSLFDVLGTRSGRGSMWIEVDLRFKLDLGPVKVSGLTIRATLDDDGNLSASLRGLEASIALAPMIDGDGAVTLTEDWISRRAGRADHAARDRRARRRRDRRGHGEARARCGPAGPDSAGQHRAGHLWNGRHLRGQWPAGAGPTGKGSGAAPARLGLPEPGIVRARRSIQLRARSGDRHGGRHGLHLQRPRGPVHHHTGVRRARRAERPVHGRPGSRSRAKRRAGRESRARGVVVVDPNDGVTVAVEGTYTIPEILLIVIPVGARFPKSSADWYIHLGADGWSPGAGRRQRRPGARAGARGPAAEPDRPAGRRVPDVPRQRHHQVAPRRAGEHRAGELHRGVRLRIQHRHGASSPSSGPKSSRGPTFSSPPIRCTWWGWARSAAGCTSGIFSVGVDATVNVVIMEGSQPYLFAEVCGTVDLLFDEVRKCVKLSFNSPPPAVLPPPAHPLDSARGQSLVDDRYHVVAPLSTDREDAPTVWADAIPLLTFTTAPKLSLPAGQFPDAAAYPEG